MPNVFTKQTWFSAILPPHIEVSRASKNDMTTILYHVVVKCKATSLQPLMESSFYN